MRLGNIDFVFFFESLHITHLCISSTGGLFRLEHNTFNAWSHAKEFCQKVSSVYFTDTSHAVPYYISIIYQCGMRNVEHLIPHVHFEITRWTYSSHLQFPPHAE